MKRIAFLVVGSLLGLARSVSGCIPEAREVGAAAGYEAQQMRCVEQYADRLHIDMCRARVKQAWTVADASAEGGDR